MLVLLVFCLLFFRWFIWTFITAIDIGSFFVLLRLILVMLVLALLCLFVLLTVADGMIVGARDPLAICAEVVAFFTSLESLGATGFHNVLVGTTVQLSKVVHLTGVRDLIATGTSFGAESPVSWWNTWIRILRHFVERRETRRRVSAKINAVAFVLEVPLTLLTIANSCWWITASQNWRLVFALLITNGLIMASGSA